jgi:hypothetical protein
MVLGLAYGNMLAGGVAEAEIGLSEDAMLDDPIPGDGEGSRSREGWEWMSRRVYEAHRRGYKPAETRERLSEA